MLFFSPVLGELFLDGQDENPPGGEDDEHQANRPRRSKVHLFTERQRFGRFPGVESFSILLNHRSFQKPAVFPGFLQVFWKEGSLERMGKVAFRPFERVPSCGLKGNQKQDHSLLEALACSIRPS